MDDALIGSERGLTNIRLPVCHSVADDIDFGGCIHYSMSSVVVEVRDYYLATIST